MFSFIFTVRIYSESLSGLY